MKIITMPSSGKLGLSVRMNGRYGQVERSWVVPANPNTESQIVVRSRLGSQAARWDGLTDEQRLAWNTAAAQMRTRSRLGMSGPMTGLQYFVQANCNLDIMGEDPVDLPPSGVVVGMPAPQGLVITNTGGVIALKLTVPTSPSTNTMIRASAPINAGISRAPGLKAIGICPAPAQGSSVITSAYVATFGTPPVGKRIFVSAGIISSGIAGPIRTFSALVPASA